MGVLLFLQEVFWFSYRPFAIAQYSYTLFHKSLTKLVYHKHETPYHALSFVIQWICSTYAIVLATKYFFYTSITFNNCLECSSSGFGVPVLSIALHVCVIFASDYFSLYRIYEKISKSHFCREFYVL